MRTITYTEPKGTKSPVAGMTLTGGRPYETNGIATVRFDQEVKKGVKICATISTRPELARLVAEFEAAEVADEAERQRRFAEKKAKDAAEKAPLIAAMEAEAAELRKLIPAENVEVIRTQTGYFDGDPTFSETVDGVPVYWGDMVVHGWAEAKWPDAGAPFAQICVCSMPRTKFEETKIRLAAAAKEKEEKKQADADRIASCFAQAKETGKPVALESGAVDCNDPDEDCSTDIITIYAMPDGSRKTERQHTW